MCMFGFLKTPDVILSLVSSQKLEWTRTFDTYCVQCVKCATYLRETQYLKLGRCPDEFEHCRIAKLRQT